jgi:hypothetical protein
MVVYVAFHRRHLAAGAADVRKIFNQPTYLLKVRALRSREDRRQEPLVPDDFPPKRSAPRAPLPDLDDPDLEELPSVYKSKRRDPSPLRENGGGGRGGNGGYFSRRSGRNSSGGPPPTPFWKPDSKYVLAGLFTLGLGAGVALDSVVSFEPSNVASREVIDRQTPNPDVCIANGMSAMVLDQRLFITFNP